MINEIRFPRHLCRKASSNFFGSYEVYLLEPKWNCQNHQNFLVFQDDQTSWVSRNHNPQDSSNLIQDVEGQNEILDLYCGIIT